VAKDWDAWFDAASGPASPTEEHDRERTEARIRAAIDRAPDIPSSVRVYAKGSYANNTNVRRDSDVDVAVEWTEQFKVWTWGETAGMTAEQLNYTPVAEMITPAEFRERVELAIVGAFGAITIDLSGDKAIHVIRDEGSLDADVVPCFSLRRYDRQTVFHEGHRIFRKDTHYLGYVDNFPEQHKRNGIAKNAATGRRYKEIVRCLKRLEGDLVSDGMLTREYPGYLVECLLYNVPNDRFGHLRRYDDLDQALIWLWQTLGDTPQTNELVEVSELQWLFRDRTERSAANARDVVYKAWNRLHDNL
jgi:hypothetical protein